MWLHSPDPLSLSHLLTHSLSHSLTLSLFHSLTLSLTLAISSDDLQARTAKVSNLPGDVTLGFLDIVFTRGIPTLGDIKHKVNMNSMKPEYQMKPLKELEDFDGLVTGHDVKIRFGIAFV